jgi:predicted RNA-binding protein (virulence factor B family)
MKNRLSEKTTVDRMLREVVVTLKEEQACLQLWFKDKSVNEDVARGIEISLTKISEALGKLAAFEKVDDHDKTDNPANV